MIKLSAEHVNRVIMEHVICKHDDPCRTIYDDDGVALAVKLNPMNRNFVPDAYVWSYHIYGGIEDTAANAKKAGDVVRGSNSGDPRVIPIKYLATGYNLSTQTYEGSFPNYVSFWAELQWHRGEEMEMSFEFRDPLTYIADSLDVFTIAAGNTGSISFDLIDRDEVKLTKDTVSKLKHIDLNHWVNAAIAEANDGQWFDFKCNYEPFELYPGDRVFIVRFVRNVEVADRAPFLEKFKDEWIEIVVD